MRDREYRIGPGAVSLLLVVVVVSMSVLGLLALISSRGDYRLTERATQFVAAGYHAEAEAEYSLAALDEILADCAKAAADDESYLNSVAAALPEKMSVDGRLISWEEESDGGRTLICEVEILPLGAEVRFVRKTFMFAASGDGFSFE